MRGFRSLGLALYRAHFRRASTTLTRMPRPAALAWMVSAVEYSLDLREPWRALAFALRGLRVLPTAPAAWRTLAKAANRCLKPQALGLRKKHAGFDIIRSYPVRGMRVETGNVEPDRVVCIPLVHREGVCLAAGDYWVPEDGQYVATFKMRIVPFAFSESPLVVLDAFDNLQTHSVLAARQIGPDDVAGKTRSFDLTFHATAGQRLELRVHWKEQCFLSVTKVILRNARSRYRDSPLRGGAEDAGSDQSKR
jgi:hypothetical protein